MFFSINDNQLLLITPYIGPVCQALYITGVKGKDQLKFKNLFSFTHSHVDPDLCDFQSSIEHK